MDDDEDSDRDVDKDAMFGGSYWTWGGKVRKTGGVWHNTFVRVFDVSVLWSS